jgi:DNA-binding PadR family transcriptional regulator
MIHRLQERGLLAAEQVPDDHRGTQRFTCTDAGKDVLRSWVLSLRPEHELLHDPLRKKAQAFDLLTHQEQLDWLEEAKQRLQRKLGEVERWPPEVEGPFGEVIRDNARSSLLGRIEWLEESRRKIEQRGPDSD